MRSRYRCVGGAARSSGVRMPRNSACSGFWMKPTARSKFFTDGHSGSLGKRSSEGLGVDGCPRSTINVATMPAVLAHNVHLLNLTIEDLRLFFQGSASEHHAAVQARRLREDPRKTPSTRLPSESESRAPAASERALPYAKCAAPALVVDCRNRSSRRWRLRSQQWCRSQRGRLDGDRSSSEGMRSPAHSCGPC